MLLLKAEAHLLVSLSPRSRVLFVCLLVCLLGGVGFGRSGWGRVDEIHSQSLKSFLAPAHSGCAFWWRKLSAPLPRQERKAGAVPASSGIMI